MFTFYNHPKSSLHHERRPPLHMSHPSEEETASLWPIAGLLFLILPLLHRLLLLILRGPLSRVVPDENAPFNATRVDSKIELVECASINGNVLRKSRDVVVDQKDCRQEYWVVAYGDVLKMVPEMMMTGQNRITTVGGRFGPGEQILACILFTLLNCNKSYHISTLSISIVGFL